MHAFKLMVLAVGAGMACGAQAQSYGSYGGGGYYGGYGGGYGGGNYTSPPVVSAPSPAIIAPLLPQLVPSGSSSTLNFSNSESGGLFAETNSDAVAFLTSFSPSLTFQGTGATETRANYVNLDSGGTWQEAVALSIHNPVSGLMGSSTATVGQLALSGGFMLDTNRVTGFAKGGTATFSNLRIDPVSKQVVADAQGLLDADRTSPPVSFSSKDLVLWHIDTISGPTSLPSAVLAAGGDRSALNAQMQALGFSVTQPNLLSESVYTASYQFDGLLLSPEAHSFLRSSLGLTAASVSLMTAVQNWGSISAQANFVLTPVPEADAWGLALTGLLGLAWAARRQRNRLY